MGQRLARHCLTHWLRHKGIALIVSALLCLPLTAQAAPSLIDHTNDITIKESGTHTQINQSSQRGIINWQSFNIGANESVHFEQPSAQAITLNRVHGASASEIYGSLTATGQVWILNDAGVHFGPSASVDVAGILASTYDIGDNNFLNSNFHFTPWSQTSGLGVILNEGEIVASGLAALLSHDVENAGLIAAHAALCWVLIRLQHLTFTETI